MTSTERVPLHHRPPAATEAMLSDILITAFDGGYGGSWYWMREEARVVPGGFEIRKGESASDEVWLGITFRAEPGGEFDEPGQPPKFKIDHETVRTGIRRILNGEVGLRADLLAQVRTTADPEEFDVDADAADCIIQAGLFNKLVFG